MKEKKTFFFFFNFFVSELEMTGHTAATESFDSGCCPNIVVFSSKGTFKGGALKGLIRWPCNVKSIVFIVPTHMDNHGERVIIHVYVH